MVKLGQHLRGGGTTDRIELSAHGCEWWAGILRLKNIIEPNYRQVFGNTVFSGTILPLTLAPRQR